MAPSRAAEVAQEPKHQHGQTKLQIAASANKQQQKLSFHSSSPGSFARDCTALDASSSSKRRKLDTPPLVDLADAPSRPAAIDSMYNFSTPGSSAANAIDLGTSPANGHRRRVSSVSRVEIPSGKTGAKKLVVKNFRTTPKSDPTQYCDLTIKQLDEALTAIFADRRPTLSNEELYRGCENVCKLGKPDQLAKKLLQRIKQHVSGDLKATPSAAAGGSNVQVLDAVITAWKKWRRQLNTIRQIFAFLDRSYLLHTSQSLEKHGFQCFNTNICDVFKSQILGGAADLLMAGRVGLPQWSATLFDATVKMCYDLSIYTHGFEERMLADSQSFIAEWADDNCAKLSLADYVDAANTLIATEETRCKEFNLSTSTISSLLTVLEHQLVERREAELTNQDSVADLLDENKVDNLSRLFALLQRRRLGVKVKAAFGKWIEDTGTTIIFNEKEQDQMVVRLLDLKRSLDHIWRYAFQKNDELGIQLRESFANFMNKTKKSSITWNTDNSKPGEMIAKYVDQLLRAGAKAIPASLTTKPGLIVRSDIAKDEDEEQQDEEVDEDSELNSQLDQVLDLFRFLQGKAVFEAFYKKDLARRLLLGRSADADAERGMLTRLKNECGAGFTQNLEQMFKDIELGRDEMSSYKSRLEATGSRPPIDLSVNILSAAAWPTYPDIPIIIPPTLKKTIEGFEQHYQMKHTGRKLQWKHALAHCQLRASFPKGKKEIVVSAFQAIIMLMFNTVAAGATLPYTQIKDQSGLPEADVKRTLQSLACAKLRPLTKHPRGKEVGDNDTFSVNEDFSHDRFRVKINQLQAKETREENRATHEQVAADRKYETQAAIVRIMKTRKTIGHAELIAETINATKQRGTLQPGEIKRQIDALIEKEYMERGDGNTYAYLA